MNFEPETLNFEPFRKVALLGVGLMGGSLGLDLRRRKLAAQVVGYSRRESTRNAALAKGVMDAAAETVEEAVRDADLVVLGTPVLTYEPLLKAALPFLSPGSIVTDLGSTKAWVVRTCEALLAGSEAAFVGGHPMAGSEDSGPEAARVDLYRDVVWCLTPVMNTPKSALGKVKALVEAVGARTLILSPEDHDRAVAGASHVPHLVAAALVNGLNSLSEGNPAAVQLAAGGFRDTTRVASGSPEMWRDICLTNRDGIVPALRAFRDALEAIENAIVRGEGEALEAHLGAAKAFRDRMWFREFEPPGE